MVTVNHVHTDAFGNAISASIDVTTNMPSAIVQGTLLKNVVDAGTWAVVSRVSCTNTTATSTLTVIPPGPAGAAAVDLSLSSAVLEAGSTPLSASFTSFDAFGNAVSPQPNATISASPAVIGLPLTGASPRIFSIGKTGTFAITANIGAGITDTESVQVVDTTPPTFNDTTTTLVGFTQGPITDGLIDANDTLQFAS